MALLTRRTMMSAASSGLLAGLSPLTAFAEEWPSKPVKLLLPVSAGGALDVVGRLFAERLSQAWGQSVVVDNRPGAGMIPGMSAAARAANDGYTIAFTPSAAATLTPFLYKNPQYNMDANFVPVTSVLVGPMMIAVNASSNIRTLSDLVKLSREGKQQVTFSAAQLNSLPHLTGEMLSRVANMKLFTVPYAGSPAAITAVLAGEATVTIEGVTGLYPHIKAGKLRAIAVTSEKRLPGFEDIPTVSETYKGFESVGWVGMFVPAGTPQAIVNRIATDANQVLRNQDLIQRCAELGMYPRPSNPTEFKQFVSAQANVFRGWVSELGLQPQ